MMIINARVAICFFSFALESIEQRGCLLTVSFAADLEVAEVCRRSSDDASLLEWYARELEENDARASAWDNGRVRYRVRQLNWPLA